MKQLSKNIAYTLLAITLIFSGARAEVDQDALKILNYYIDFIERHQLKCQYKVGFSFCSDMDVVVDANKLLPALGLGGEVEVTDEIANQRIETMEDFEKLMKYYMTKGIGEEKYIYGKETFDRILQASLDHKVLEDIGGNAVIMAQRAELEGCDVTLGAKFNQELSDKYMRGNIKLASEGSQLNDYHISIRYYINDDFWPIDIPRSNRLFVNRDVDNQFMGDIDEFLNYVETEKPQMIAVSGFQLLVNKTLTTKNLKKLSTRLNSRENKDLITHVEMAAFSDESLHKLFLTHFIERVDSVGANEREMIEMYEFMAKMLGREMEKIEIKAKMDHSYLIAKMQEMLGFIDALGLRMSRVHVHTLTNHMICFVKDIWKGGKYSLSKGIQVSLEVSTLSETLRDLLKDPENLRANLPSDITYDSMYGRVTRTREDILKKPTFSLHVDEKWKCSVGVTVEVKVPKRIRGLGDNISGAGLVHHKLRSFFEQDDENEEAIEREDL